jgi:hypothetical protein
MKKCRDEEGKDHVGLIINSNYKGRDIVGKLQEG